MRPAVFLDRDGTICEEVGYLEPHQPLASFSLCRRPPFAGSMTRECRSSWSPINPASRGDFSRRSGARNARADHRGTWPQHGAHIDGFYYCPHSRAGRSAIAASRCRACWSRPRGSIASTWGNRMWSATVTWTSSLAHARRRPRRARADRLRPRRIRIAQRGMAAAARLCGR